MRERGNLCTSWSSGELLPAATVTAMKPAAIHVTGRGNAGVRATNSGGANCATVRLEARDLPVIAGLRLTSTQAGDRDFALTVDGARLLAGSTAEWTGAVPATISVRAAKLTAMMSANMIASTASAAVDAVNLSGLPWAAANFNMAAPVPVITSPYPPLVERGVHRGGLAVHGTGFPPNSVVKWTGVVLPMACNSWTLVIRSPDLRNRRFCPGQPLGSCPRYYR